MNIQVEKKHLSCFRAYDGRGKIDVEIDEDVAYCVGRAVAQHLKAKSIVVGYVARSTSEDYAAAVGRGVCDAGADVLSIGMVGTEEMYWAVTEFGACAGIEVTASHNPIDYNGMKIVKSGSRPLDDASDFQPIRALAQIELWTIGQDYVPGVYILPKALDEKVARLHLKKIGVKLTELRKEQADYIGVTVDGPFKSEHYRY